MPILIKINPGSFFPSFERADIRVLLNNGSISSSSHSRFDVDQEGDRGVQGVGPERGRRFHHQGEARSALSRHFGIILVLESHLN